VHRLVTASLSAFAVALVLSACTPTGPGGPAAPTEDSATGHVTAGFFGDVVIDAHSGPSGQQPHGSVTVQGAVDFGGPVTCLGVTGPVAVVNVQTPEFGLVTMSLTDGAVTSMSDVVEGIPTGRAPDDCSPFSGGIREEVTSGDLVVVDAEPDLLNLRATGAFAGTAPFELQHGCAFAHERFVLAVTPLAGPGSTLRFDGCVLLTGLAPTGYEGTFRYLTDGGRITGTVAGSYTPPSPSTGDGSFDVTLTVGAASGDFCGATGSLRAKGTLRTSTDASTYDVGGHLLSDLHNDAKVSC
jgi:hypothetical protein